MNYLLAFFTGLISAIIATAVFDGAFHVFYAIVYEGPGFIELCKNGMPIPAGLQLIPVIDHFFGASIGFAVSYSVAKKAKIGLSTGAILGYVIFALLPYLQVNCIPVWVIMVDILSMGLGSYLGYMLGRYLESQTKKQIITGPEK